MIWVGKNIKFVRNDSIYLLYHRFYFLSIVFFFFGGGVLPAFLVEMDVAVEAGIDAVAGTKVTG